MQKIKNRLTWAMVFLVAAMIISTVGISGVADELHREHRIFFMILTFIMLTLHVASFSLVAFALGKLEVMTPAKLKDEWLNQNKPSTEGELRGWSCISP